MKIEFPNKEGDEIIIYQDWENQETVLGTAKLVGLHQLGRSFILIDTYPESEQIVYNYQIWEVEWPDKSRSLEKIRYIDSIGITNSAPDEEYEDENPGLPKDSFIIINGISCF